MAAEVTDARPIFRVLIPDTAMLLAQLLLTLAILSGARASRATLSLLTGPRPGLLNLCLLLAGSFSEMTGTVVGDTIAATHGPGWGSLTSGTHTLPSQAHCPESTHCVSAGLAVSS